MSTRHLQVLLFYGAFVGLSVLLALARRWLRPASTGPSVWKKYPTYILLNLVFLVLAWLPTTWHGLALLLGLIGAGVSWEISHALGLSRFERVGLPVVTASLVLAAEWLTPNAFLLLWLGSILLAVAISAFTSPCDHFGGGMLGLAGSVVYLPICLVSLIWLWHMHDGGFRVVFFYLVIASNDAFAQITGQLVGGRLLAPAISPGKTVAGAVGGVVCATVVGAILGTTLGWSAGVGACIGVTLGIAGQIGDLVESRWKRALGVKDFSRLLGAQGGVFDRFDALIFAAPVFYLLLSI